jgi:ParB family transcriptional regulator, chromosome partitioning protein
MSQMSTDIKIMNMNCEPNDAASESAPLQYPAQQIPLRFIDVGNRLRRLKAAKLIDITESLADRGLLQAIIVKPTEDGRYALLAGNYRKAAAEKLGWETIRAEVREGLSEDESLLIEIDENLKRNDLSPAERAKHTAERKKIYERNHPETMPTKKGGPGRGKQTRRQIGDESAGAHKSAERFTKDTAAKSGQSERTIQRDARRGETKRIEEIEGTCLDTGAEIDAVQQLQQLDPAKADELIDQAVAGKKVSAKAEVAKTKPPRKIKTRAPRHDESIALQQTQAELKQSQAEVERLKGELWNQRAGDGALETPMAVITTLVAILAKILAKIQVENFWGDASHEAVKKLILALDAAVAAANTIKSYLNKAEAYTASVNGS